MDSGCVSKVKMATVVQRWMWREEKGGVEDGPEVFDVSNWKSRFAV